MKILSRKLMMSFLLFLPLISGCSSTMNITDYKDNKPSLDLFGYFTGETKGWGIFNDRKGHLRRQFVVDIKGEINDAGELVLEEYFIWNDGEKSKRVWTIKKSGINNFIGSADDVSGMANGVSAGNAFYWKYTLNLPVGEKVYKVRFDDWMFLQPDGVLLNKAKMSKFGFSVGEVIISFKKTQ